MNRTISHVVFCIVTIAFLVMPAGPFGALGQRAHAAGVSGLVLLASSHAGTVTADLGEQVEFFANSASPLASSESIALFRVEGKKLLSRCPGNPCFAGDAQDNAVKYSYRAYIIEPTSRSTPKKPKFKVVVKSNIVTVEWKRFTLKPSCTADFGVKKCGSHGVDALFGVPFQLNLKLPHGASTSWKALRITWDDTASCPEGIKATCQSTGTCPISNGTFRGACAPEIPAAYGVLSAGVPPADLTRQLHVEFLGAGTPPEIAVEFPIPVTYKAWKINLDGTSSAGTGGATTALTLKDKDTGTVTASITEQGADRSSAYFTHFEIQKTSDSTVYKDCTNDFPICKQPVQGSELSSTDPLTLKSEVYQQFPAGRAILGQSGQMTVSKDCSSGPFVEARATRRLRPSAQSCGIPTGNYYIQYKISGGTGDCSPAPPQGYSGCHPGQGGSVQLTATVKQIVNSVSTIPASLPSGYRIRWESHPSIAGMPKDCPLGQPTCIITVQDPGPSNRVVDFYAQVERDSPFDTLAYDTLKLTVSWT